MLLENLLEEFIGIFCYTYVNLMDMLTLTGAAFRTVLNI